MEDDLSEIIFIIKTKKPVQKYIDEYYRTTNIMDEYAKELLKKEE